MTKNSGMKYQRHAARLEERFVSVILVLQKLYYKTVLMTERPKFMDVICNKITVI